MGGKMKRILLISLFLLCQTNFAAVKKCEEVDDFVMLSTGEKLKLTQYNFRLFANPSNVAELIAKYGREIKITKNNGSYDINGSAATPLSMDEVRGNMNQGVYFSYRPDGRASIFKLLPVDAIPANAMSHLGQLRILETPGSDRAGISGAVRDLFSDLNLIGRDLAGEAMCESQGGPIVYGFGNAIISKDGTETRNFYVELQWMFPGKETKTVKSLRNLRDPWLHPQYYEKVIQRISSLIANAMIDGICTADPDFIISKDGDVSWVDSALWTRIDWKTENLETQYKDAYPGVILDGANSLAKRLTQPEQIQEILARVKSEITATSKLTAEEKQKLLKVAALQ